MISELIARIKESWEKSALAFIFGFTTWLAFAYILKHFGLLNIL